MSNINNYRKSIAHVTKKQLCKYSIYNPTFRMGVVDQCSVEALKFLWKSCRCMFDATQNWDLAL